MPLVGAGIAHLSQMAFDRRGMIPTSPRHLGKGSVGDSQRMLHRVAGCIVGSVFRRDNGAILADQPIFRALAYC